MRTIIGTSPHGLGPQFALFGSPAASTWPKIAGIEHRLHFITAPTGKRQGLELGFVGLGGESDQTRGSKGPLSQGSRCDNGLPWRRRCCLLLLLPGYHTKVCSVRSREVGISSPGRERL